MSDLKVRPPKNRAAKNPEIFQAGPKQALFPHPGNWKLLRAPENQGPFQTSTNLEFLLTPEHRKFSTAFQSNKSSAKTLWEQRVVFRFR